MENHYEMGGCPACGATAATTLATREDLIVEMEELWTFHSRRLRPETPPARLADRTVFSQDAPLRLACCGGCGLVFRNPRQKERDLRDTYSGEEPEEDALEALFRTQRESHRGQAGRLTRLLGRTGSGLEVGSYVGAFLAASADLGWSFEGVDVNPSAVRFAAEKGFTVQEGTLEDVDPERRFDAVVIWNTFEQLPNPRATAGAVLGLLNPGGIFAVRVPNGDFYRSWRRPGLGRPGGLRRAVLAHNNLLGFPYRHGFTPGSLRLMLERVGFRPERLVGDTLVPISDEWTRPWAAMEERTLKRMLRISSPLLPSPWFELYARPAG